MLLQSFAAAAFANVPPTCQPTESARQPTFAGQNFALEAADLASLADMLERRLAVAYAETCPGIVLRRVGRLWLDTRNGVIYRARLSALPSFAAQIEVPVEVMQEGKSQRMVHLMFQTLIPRDVCVARIDISPGQQVDAAICAVDRRLLPLSQQTLEPERLADPLYPVKARRSLRQGEIVKTEAVVRVPAVARNDELVVDISPGSGIAVQTMALAQADGQVGQRIAVRNPSNNETYYVVVTGRRTAAVR